MNKSLKDAKNRLPYFLGSIFALVGGLSAIGMAISAHEWVITASVVCVCAAAVPTIVTWIKKVIE